MLDLANSRIEKKMKIIVGLFKLLLLLILLTIIAGAGLVWYVSNQPPKSFIESNIKRFTGYTARLEGDVTLSLWPKLDVTMENVTVQAFSGERPLFVGENILVRLPEWLSLLDGLIIDTVQVDNPAVYLHQPKTGLPNWESPYRRGGRSSGEVSLIPINDLKVTNLNFTLRDEQAGYTRKLEKVNVTIAGHDSSSLNLAAAGRYNTWPFQINGRFGAQDPSEIPLLLGARLPQVSLDIKGVVKNRSIFQGEISVLSPKLEDMLKIYAPQAVLPGRLDLPLKLKVAGQFGALRQQVDTMNISLGEAVNLAGKAQVSLVDKNASAQVKAASLNLTRLGLCREGGDTSGQKGNSPWNDTPLGLSVLREWMLDIRLDIQNLSCAGQPFQAVSFRVANDRQNFTLHDFALYSGSGKVLAQAGFDIRKGLSGSVDMTLVRLPVEGFLSDKLRQKIQLPLNGDIKLTMAGQTTRELAASLEGRVDVSATEGKIPGSFITGMALSLEKALAGVRGAGGELDKFVARYSLADGVARAEEVELRTAKGQIHLVAEGKIDIANWTINHRLEPVVEASTILKVPITVRGSLSNPAIVPEVATLENLATGVGAVVGGPAGAAIGKVLGRALGGETKGTSAASPTENNSTKTPKPANPLENLLRGF
jgi:uncharacterized protein involved in outer membrane biogenesis